MDRFLQGELANFSAFKYVNELNNNIEQLQEKVCGELLSLFFSIC